MPLFGPPDVEKLKSKRDIRGLNKALQNKDPNIVRRAAFALAELDQFAHALMFGINNTDWKIRHQMYMYCAKFIHWGFIPLLASLHDQHEMVRITGLTLLVARKDKRGLQPIANCLLHDPSANVRSVAAQALSSLGGHEALEFLLEARNDSDSSVKKAVNEILENLGY
jgi:HEAT repeat protein